MKLLSFKIYSFGGLKDEFFEFKDGITCICKSNGFGKTTIAAFLTAMFYGMTSVRSNSREFSDRKHYTPFGGGKFGGNVRIMLEGKEYTVERLFDPKSETNDEFRVYSGTEEIKNREDFTGEKLFGYDRESFERTAFMNSVNADGNLTKGITAGLMSIIDNIDEETDVEGVCKKLSEKAKSIKSKKKGNGIYYEKQDELIKLTSKISDAGYIYSGLDEKYNRRDKLSEEIKAAKEAEAAAMKLSTLKAHRKHCESLKGEIEDLKQKGIQIENEFSKGFPSIDETSSIRRYADEIRQSDAVIERKKKEVDNKAAEIEEFKQYFAKGIPDDIEIKEIKDKLKTIEDNEQSAEQNANSQMRERLNELGKRFGGKTVPNDFESLKEAQREYLDAEKEIGSLQNQLGELSKQKEKKKAGIIFVLPVLAAVLVTLAFTIKVSNPVRFSLIGTAVLSAAVFVILLTLGGKKNKNRQSDDILKKIETIKVAKDNAEARISDTVSKAGYSSDNIMLSLGHFISDYDEFRSLTVHEENNARKTSELREINDLLRRQTDSFAERYGFDVPDGVVTDDFLEMLKKKINDFGNLMRQINDGKEAIRSEQEIIDKNVNEIDEIMKRYGFEYKDPEEADTFAQKSDESRKTYDVIVRTYETKSDELDGYISDNNVSFDDREEEYLNLDDIEELINSKYRERNILDAEISKDEEQTNKISAYEAEREDLKDEISALEEKHKLLNFAAEYLEAADKELKSKYVAPVKYAFDVYAEKIGLMPGTDFTMDDKFNVFFNREGLPKEDSYLSAGQKTQEMLCLRLAIADNIYDKEKKPFFVLDDPFVNVDSEHMEKIKDALKILSKDFQIIYLCCHESRSI